MGGSGSNLREVHSLPDDALVEILSRLRAKSLCRCKCVSKPWRDLIADRLCCKDLPKTLQGFLYFDLVSSDGDGDGGSGGGVGGGGGGDDGDADAEGGDLASGRDKMLLRHGDGRFINMLGETMPLLDPSFAFMKERPGVEAIELLDSCNGLLLFGHSRVSDTYHSLGYIVCNPVTEQWVAVPSSGWTPNPPEGIYYDTWARTFLIRDPSVWSHFDLVQFWYAVKFRMGGFGLEVEGVHTYSSVTGVWSNRSAEWRGHGGGSMIWEDSAALARTEVLEGWFWSMAGPLLIHGRALVNGMHILANFNEIVAMDSQGRICRVLQWPDERMLTNETNVTAGFIGQSQGRVHCVCSWYEGSSTESYGMSIWVLENYNTEEEEWVLKHSLSLRHLFERVDDPLNHYDCRFVSLHTDRNIMFFLDDKDQKLISYNMDSREVHVLCTPTPGQGSYFVTPYVPSFKSL